MPHINELTPSWSFSDRFHFTDECRLILNSFLLQRKKHSLKFTILAVSKAQFCALEHLPVVQPSAPSRHGIGGRLFLRVRFSPRGWRRTGMSTSRKDLLEKTLRGKMVPKQLPVRARVLPAWVQLDGRARSRTAQSLVGGDHPPPVAVATRGPPLGPGRGARLPADGGVGQLMGAPSRPWKDRSHPQWMSLSLSRLGLLRASAKLQSAKASSHHFSPRKGRKQIRNKRHNCLCCK